MAPSDLLFSHHMDREAERFLAEAIGEKQLDYGIVIDWLRAKLSQFNLLRSAVLCVRRSGATKHQLNIDVNGAEITNAIGKID